MYFGAVPMFLASTTRRLAYMVHRRQAGGRAEDAESGVNEVQYQARGWLHLRSARLSYSFFDVAVEQTIRKCAEMISMARRWALVGGRAPTAR